MPKIQVLEKNPKIVWGPGIILLLADLGAGTQPTILKACPRTRAWPWTQIQIPTSLERMAQSRFWSMTLHSPEPDLFILVAQSKGWVPGVLYDPPELEVWLHIPYGSVCVLELNLDLELDLKFLMVIGWSVKIQDNHLHLDHILDLALDFSILKGAV